MDGFLRQSTATSVKLGPFKDSTDGDTNEGALTITQTDVRLSKNHGDFAQKNSATALSYDEAGYYDCALSTTDTNTTGTLKIVVHEAGALTVEKNYVVVTAAVYDLLLAASAAGFATIGAVSDIKSQLVVVASDLVAVQGSVSDVISDLVDLSNKQDSDMVILATDHAQIVSDIGELAFDAGSLTSQQASQLTQVVADVILLKESRGVIDEGTAQSVGAASIQLRAGAAFADDEVKGATVWIVSASTGAGQARTVLSYDGDTDTAQVEPWETMPTGIITYKVFATPETGSLTTEQDSRLTRVASDAVVIEAAISALSLKQDSDMVVLAADHAKTQSDIAAIEVSGGGLTAAQDSKLTKVVADIADLDTDVVALTSDVAELDTDVVAALTTKLDSDMVLLLAEHEQTQSDIAALVFEAGGLTSAQDSRLTKVTADVIALTTKQDSDMSIVGNATTQIISDLGDLSAKADSDMIVLLVDNDKTQSDIAAAAGLTTAQASKLTQVQSDVIDISGRLPAALNNGVMPADIQRINDRELGGTGVVGDEFDIV